MNKKLHLQQRCHALRGRIAEAKRNQPKGFEDLVAELTLRLEAAEADLTLCTDVPETVKVPATLPLQQQTFLTHQQKQMTPQQQAGVLLPWPKVDES